MPYRQRVPHRVPEVEVEEPYYDAPPMVNRGSLLLFFVLLLLVGWVLYNRNEGFNFLGTGWASRPVEWSTSDRPVSDRPVSDRPVSDRPVAFERGERSERLENTRPLPADPPRRKPVEIIVTPPARRSVVEATPVPVRPRQVEKGKFGKPSIGYRRDPDVIGYAWLIADGVNLRRGPGADYEIIYLLPGKLAGGHLD